jgi:hypothetical protein
MSWLSIAVIAAQRLDESTGDADVLSDACLRTQSNPRPLNARQPRGRYLLLNDPESPAISAELQYVDRWMLLDLLEIVSLSRGAKNITLRFPESRFQAHAYGEIRALAKSDHSLQRSRKRLNFPKFVFDLHTSPPIQPGTGLRMHISDEHRAAGSEHLSDFGKKRSGVFDVTQNKIAQNQVRGARFE